MSIKAAGGYRVDVVNGSDKERFTCLLCLKIIRIATHGCTNHLFCKDCIVDYIQANKNEMKLSCPAGCGTAIDKNKLQSNNPIDQFINSVLCKCPECDWKGELYEFVQQHEPNCKERKIQCHICEEFFEKKDIEGIACNKCTKLLNCADHIKRKLADVHLERNDQNVVEVSDKYFSDENTLLKSAIKDLQSNVKGLVRLNKEHELELNTIRQSLKDANEKLQTLTLKYENILEKVLPIKDENSALKNYISSLSLKILKNVFLIEPVKCFLKLSQDGTLVIKKHTLSIMLLKGCFDVQNFSPIIEDLKASCQELQGYENELKELILTRSSVIVQFDKYNYGIFFNTKTLTRYEDRLFSIDKIDNKYYFQGSNVLKNRLVLSISKWDISITKEPIDVLKPDHRFKLSAQPFTSDCYGFVI